MLHLAELALALMASSTGVALVDIEATANRGCRKATIAAPPLRII
jgi:hypothetical protein